MPSPETVEVLAQLSTDGAVTWLTTNWFKLALLIVAAGLFFAAMKQSIPAPDPRSTIVSPAASAAAVTGLPQP